MQPLVEYISESAKAEADRLRAIGWTKQDFAKALASCLTCRVRPTAAFVSRTSKRVVLDTNQIVGAGTRRCAELMGALGVL